MAITPVKSQQINLQKIAFFIALLIHFSGLVGMLFFNRSWFVALTPVNLLIMAVLLGLTHRTRSGSFYGFVLLCWCTGMLVEIIGVNTGLLFGEYNYGEVLGPGFAGVPFLIGVNWFSIIYSSAAIANKFLPPVVAKNAVVNRGLQSRDFAVSFAGAMMATFFDWVMEPVAVKLDYWQWKPDGSIPLYNYLCWFVVSFFLLLMCQLIKLNMTNRFAVRLFIIQLIFFILLRWFLPN